MADQNTSAPTPYPLAWPSFIKRTDRRRRSNFGKRNAKLSVTQAIERLNRELRLLNARELVVSTNIAVRRDGMPYANQAEPIDPGVAIYFMRAGKSLCFPCDRWDRVADNIAAIAAHIGAMRAQERWGVGTIDQAFAGYTLRLPAQASLSSWREVLGDCASLGEAEEAARRLLSEHHPDKHAGDPQHAAAFQRVLAARTSARAEFTQ